MSESALQHVYSGEIALHYNFELQLSGNLSDVEGYKYCSRSKIYTHGLLDVEVLISSSFDKGK